MSFLRALGLLALSPMLLGGCGGATESGSGGQGLDQDGGGSPGTAGSGGSASGGSAGSATGGTSVGGSAGSGTAGSGQAGSGTGGVVACCEAVAVCNDGDTWIAGPDQCPPGGNCYQNSVCCSTVWCIRATVTCGAVPSCDPGDREVDSCPPEFSCYERSLCGTTIWCLNTLPDGGPAPSYDGGACDPSTEYNRSYVGSSPSECQVIDFACPVGTTYFGNDCGCGCEQDASCPEYVGCMPGPGTVDPLCSQPALCPYTIRAL